MHTREMHNMWETIRGPVEDVKVNRNVLVNMDLIYILVVNWEGSQVHLVIGVFLFDLNKCFMISLVSWLIDYYILHKDKVVGIHILKVFFQYCLIISGIKSRWTSNEDFAAITFYGSPYQNGFTTESDIFLCM